MMAPLVSRRILWGSPRLHGYSATRKALAEAHITNVSHWNHHPRSDLECNMSDTTSLSYLPKRYICSISQLLKFLLHDATHSYYLCPTTLKWEVCRSMKPPTSRCSENRCPGCPPGWPPGRAETRMLYKIPDQWSFIDIYSGKKYKKIPH